MTNEKYYLTMYYAPTKEKMFDGTEITVGTYLELNSWISKIMYDDRIKEVLEFDSICKKHTFFIHRATLQQCVITLSKI